MTAVLRIGQHLANIVRDRLPELRGVEEKIAPMKELFGHRRPLLGLVATREVDTALRASERSIESHRQYIKHLRQLEKEEESLDSIIESVSAAEAQIRQEMDRQQQMQGLHSAAGERMRLCANQLGDMSRCSDDFQRIQETEAEQNAQLQSLLNTQPKQHSVVVNLLLGIQDSPGESFGENGRWLDWNPENDLEALPLPLRNRLRGRNLPLLLGLWKRAWEFLGQVGGNPTDTRHRSFLSTEDNSKEVKDTEDALSQLFATGPDGKENARASATVERGFADILNKTSEQIRYTALKNFLPRLIQVVANEPDELNQSIREILADIGDTSTVAEKQQDQTQKLKSTERDRKALSTEWINHTASWNEHLDFITARIDAINTIGQQNFFQESTLLLGQAAVTGTSFKPFKFELLRKTFEKELRELQASLEPSREVIYKEDLAKLEEKKSSQVTVVNECKERLSAVHRKLKNSLAKLEDTRDTFVGDATGEQDESTHNFVQHLEELHGLLSEERNATKTGAIFKKLEDNGANIVAQLRGKAGPRPRKTSLDKQLAEVDEQIHAEIGRLTEQGYDPAHWPTPLSGERHSANSLDIWRNRVDRLEDVSKEAESVLASLQPTVVLDHVRKQAAEKELPLEYELETANGTKERHKEKLEEAKKALEKYETQYGEEQDWWAEKHGSIPVSLRVSGRQAPDIHHPFYIWELIDLHNSDPQRWSDELERQRGLEKTATPIARDWIVRLRQRREEDLATLKPDFIEKANVIGVTCGAAASELTKHTDEGPDRRTPFDVVIIDESSRATLPELLLAILEGKKTVLVGDQKQLPPILLPNVSEEIAAEYEDVEREELRHLETPLFGKLYNTAPDSLRAMLTIQYRMRPAIMGAINQFYEHKLTGGEAVKQHGMHIGPLEPGTSIAWVHTPLNKDNRETTDRRKSKTNKEEVAFIKLMLQKMNASWERAMGADKTLQRKEVGVITFYKAQEWRLKEAIVERGNSDNFRALDIRIGTVDRFQGMERSVVLVSLVRNNKNGNIGFTDRPERINVAFSRARELLVIVGCKTLFTQKAENATKALSIYNKVSEVVRRRGLGISVSDFQLN